MNRQYWILLVLIGILAITYFTGPTIPTPKYSTTTPVYPENLQELEEKITTSEASFQTREDNEARIIWQDSIPKKTEYSIVYLHGFAGSYQDGFPVNVNIADTLHANIYLARWSGHGLKPPHSLNDFTPDNAWMSAKEALEIGKTIGKKVIIMSTSTGGTLALNLAATYPESVYAIINMGPNVEDDMPGTFILNSHWGYEIANLISLGSNKKIEHEQEIARNYWDTIYPSKALVDLQVLVESTMTPKTFKKINSPVLTLFYKKNAFEKDEHVEVSVYPEMYELLSTPSSKKKLVALKTPETHFVGSEIKSKDTKIVEKEIVKFLTENLKIDLNTLK
ncbi:Esterase/lipase [Gillisia sp. Hel1_33_143]|uniref:alpha/beta hydrolase n=1 Tax=Gillisia sp. Hel1_33_143 TaxID=1336796 RepID=UPI00087CD872|nr:alpha/beta fold hydrolase [Gillisia sp. Hel1_33_143]SDR70819.1 Esterase/lipase [Gillisia sp. Hel1_33_143]